MSLVRRRQLLPPWFLCEHLHLLAPIQSKRCVLSCRFSPRMNANLPYAKNPLEVSMVREQMINFLQAAIIFLLITKAFATTAAVCAARLLNGAPLERRQAEGVVERGLELISPSKG
jgi:hypothetical protein